MPPDHSLYTLVCPELKQYNDGQRGLLPDNRERLNACRNCPYPLQDACRVKCAQLVADLRQRSDVVEPDNAERIEHRLGHDSAVADQLGKEVRRLKRYAAVLHPYNRKPIEGWTRTCSRRRSCCSCDSASWQYERRAH